MKRFGCNGNCPNYDLTVQPDGKVVFVKVIVVGVIWSKSIGKWEDKLNEEQLKQLVAEIERADFFSLQNAYTNESGNCPNSATDNATVTLFIKLNEKEKTITHYLGCRNDKESIEKQSNAKNSSKIRTGNFEALAKQIFPQQLFNLENKIDEIVETKRWIGERK